MSTKTTFKRVALVAVAALSLGVLTSVAPASAADNSNLTASVSYKAATSTAATNADSNGAATTYTVASHNFIVGQYVTIDANVNTYDVTNAPVIAVTTTSVTVVPASAVALGSSAITGNLVLGTSNKTVQGLAGPANTVTITSSQATVKEYVVLSGGTFTDGTTAKTLGTGAAVGTAVILTPTAGTITVSGYAETAAGSGLFSATATDSLSIIVTGTTAAAGFAAGSVAVAANGSTARVIVDLDGNKSYRASASKNFTTSAFDATVTQKDSDGVTIVSASATKAVTATISGVGTLSMDNSVAQGGYVAASAGALATHVVSVFADGRSGKGTVTISVNGVVSKTFDVTFYGAVAKYVVTTNANYTGVGSNVGTFTVTSVDANGVEVPNSPVYASSSSKSIATVETTHNTGALPVASTTTTADYASVGSVDFYTTGVAKGKFTVTFTDLAYSATITATGSSMVTGSQAATINWSFDQADYVVGAKGKVTFTLADSDANPVADGWYYIFKSTPTYTLLGQNLGVNTWVQITDGVGSWPFWAPVNSGTLTISGTIATNDQVAPALRGVASTITATVSNTDVQAATDAAAEATDAANAATDAANAAAEAADAATAAAQDAADAVAALSAQVADLIAGLKAQLTSLTNLVIKIQKKVKA